MRTTKDRDVILGKAVVRAIQKECETEHPELGEMAVLIDGKLSPDERNRIMGHVASCDRCYELFSMSSEMAKERQGVSQTARFRMPLAIPGTLSMAWSVLMSRTTQFRRPLALAAGLLIIIGALFAYKGIYFPSPEVVALKVAPQKEAPRVSAPAELKEPPASLIASVQEKKREEVKHYKNNREEKPATVFYAEVAVNDAVGEFLNDTPDDVVTDKKKIGELIAMLVEDNKAIGRYDISEVRIERGETLMRSVRKSAGKVEIRIKNSVLTIKFVD